MAPPPRPDNSMELAETITQSGKDQTQYHAQVDRRRKNRQGIIENPLAYLTDEELQHDVNIFWKNCLSAVNRDDLLRAARVAQNARSYDEVARSEDPRAGYHLPVHLSDEEKVALKAEKDVLFSQRGMFTVILTVSLAAFLQGFVQSSINGASLYATEFGLPNVTSTRTNFTTIADENSRPQLDDWKLGATNASPFFFAALMGCWLSLPLNDRIGRRGAMAVAACLIFASSLGSAWCSGWRELLLVRIVNGIGMGVKACSTPILAAETAVGFWRGSFILAWQLWVAFGIMIGFAFNLIFYTAHTDKLSLQLILGAPFVPSIFLMIGLWFCPESPRYYMRQRTSSYNPQKAYDVLLKLRKTKLQALRDTYLVYKSVQLEEYSDDSNVGNLGDDVPRGFVAHIKNYASQYKELFAQRRLRNALISSSIVALAQQLCGSTLFSGVLANGNGPLMPMVYSLGIGAVNFVFGLPAIRTIDTLGRRKWLVLTLPVMCLLMMAAALSSLITNQTTRVGIIALFVFLFAAAYSPGMGPIPFTLASESFPLSHREAGCAFAIMINLLFAGLIQMFFPSIYASLHDGGSLALFAGLNLLAFVLVFLFVEETKRRSLEDLDLVFAVRKRDFVRHQVTRYLPWFFRRYALGRTEDKPSLYVDLIWNGPRTQPHFPHVDEDVTEEQRGGDGGVPMGNDWNGFASNSGQAYGGEENVSPSSLRRPSGLIIPDYTARISEDSDDSAHR
ncbi:putative polyol transporter 1 [Daldinia childiae]|uniref:putative polyol transporter 1 n=1 Tax=Daldinia childiae TaxID=326645 RepID=UPI00144544BF|nr:putative polyol transporter 1 [Daldinia childiae]KAF3054845.1 putative polyol transporter 1 [Daldinia childiae]